MAQPSHTVMFLTSSEQQLITDDDIMSHANDIAVAATTSQYWHLEDTAGDSAHDNQQLYLRLVLTDTSNNNTSTTDTIQQTSTMADTANSSDDSKLNFKKSIIRCCSNTRTLH
jgi:hypothetical protein